MPPEPIAPQTPPADQAAPPNETPEQKYARLYETPAQAPAVPGAQPPDPVAAALAAMQNELTQLRQMQQRPQAPTAQPAPAVPAQATQLTWVKKIQEGDFQGAEAALSEAVQASMKPQLDSVRTQAYQDAMNAAQVNLEVDRYLQTVRTTNPDIVPFERYLEGPVTQRLQLAQQAGKIHNSGDFIREYKAAVDHEVGTLRNLGLTLRGQGKDEALTRSSEVLRSTTLTPQQVQSNQQVPPNSQNTPQGEDANDYFARRRADESRRKGLL